MTNLISQNDVLTKLSRRAVLFGGAFALAGCTTTSYMASGTNSAYGARRDGQVDMPAIDVSGLNPKYLRQQVAYSGREKPGTVVVDPKERFLYLVQPEGKAMRYGVGVGKEGLAFQGQATIQRKAEWPGWTPTPNMIAREPGRYGPYAGGLPGGLANPLGARALYLYRDGKDTHFRLHGTNEPASIGQSVSSGCIRLFNQDIIDLYERTPIGARVVVI